MITLTKHQINQILETYTKLNSIRKTAAALNLKPNIIYKTIKLKLTPETEIIKDTKNKVISKNNITQTLLENLTIKLLKELKLKYKDIKPEKLPQAISNLLQGKLKIEGLAIEETKLSLVSEIYGNYNNMLKLAKEIKELEQPKALENNVIYQTKAERPKLEELEI